MAVDVTQPVYPPATRTPIASTWGQAVSDSVVQKFTSPADRAAKWINPPVGSVSTVGASGILEIYRAGAWRPIAETSQIPAIPPAQLRPRSTVGHYNGPVVEVPPGAWYKIDFGIYQPAIAGEIITMQVTGLVGSKETGGHVYAIPGFNGEMMAAEATSLVGNLPGGKQNFIATAQTAYASGGQTLIGVFLLANQPSTIECVTWNVMSYPP